ncbi:MAG TPA: ATP-binding protein [Nitrososphaeraceae archaeon]|nr:ATP-binding protein [Nitrososphaeraceae archaeon]
MTVELKVHPSFFKEFATKTWVSPNDIIKEMIENAFDEDATKVLITIVSDGTIVIEDDAGMDEDGIDKFLVLGSPHKKSEFISPRLKRTRTGRYGTGRLSFLTSFDSMKMRTKRDGFRKSIVIDSSSLDDLYKGNSRLKELDEPLLVRNGTELTLSKSKVNIDPIKLVKEIRKLPILRYPLFEVYWKSSNGFKEWDLAGAQMITPPDIQGHRIPVNIESPRIVGEIIIAKRPLSEEERGIGIMIRNHIVTRTSFDLDSRLSRITGLVRCDTLTSRFADKSALIEDEEYQAFHSTMKQFILETVLPSLSEYEDVLITREESKIYKEIDKALGQALFENIEGEEEIEGFQLVDVKEEARTGERISTSNEIGSPSENVYSTVQRQYPNENQKDVDSGLGSSSFDSVSDRREKFMITDVNSKSISDSERSLGTSSKLGVNYDSLLETSPSVEDKFQPSTGMSTIKRIRKPIIRRTFALKKVGYKVIPYEDESDSRYSFRSESVVFVNKANSAYRSEARRGDEFLLRHIIRIVAEALAEAKHPEAKEALELQNRLIAEAIRIHDHSVTKK